MPSRKKDSIKNLSFSLIGMMVTTLIGVILPRLFIVSYGSEVNGLINSVRQIFAYFSLFEMGIGSAALQALYGPIAKRDYAKASAILAATNHFFKRSAVYYAIAVILLTVIYPLAVESDISAHIIVGIILLQGITGVIRFRVSSKLSLLMRVDGKSYILSNLGTIFTILSNIARIILMYQGFNVLWVQSVFVVVDFIQVFYIIRYTKKHYRWLDLRTTPDFPAVSQSKAVMVHQLSFLIFSNTAAIILSLFCGLAAVSVYAMYCLLFGMVSNIITAISSSVNFAMGQIFNSEKNRFIDIQETFETYYMCACFGLMTVAYIFILPFLKLYTEGITDANYLDPLVALLFVLSQFLNYGRNPSASVIDYAGHYRQTRGRTILESFINLTVSLVATHFLGIYGVLIGTIAALLYRTNDMIFYANHRLLQRSVLPTYGRWLSNFALFALVSYTARFTLPSNYTGYIPLLIHAFISSSVILILFFAVNSLLNKQARQLIWMHACPIIKKITFRHQ